MTAAAKEHRFAIVGIHKRTGAESRCSYAAKSAAILAARAWAVTRFVTLTDTKTGKEVPFGPYVDAAQGAA